MPPVPASRVEPTTEDHGLLIWVRHGRLEVTLDHASPLTATTGQAVWIPPGMRHAVELPAGSVAVPLLVEIVSRWPEQPTVLTIPADWSAWVLHRLSRWFGFASGFDAGGAAPTVLLADLEPASRAGMPRLPPMPRSGPARMVVERLLRDPALPADLDELASEAHVGRRTLQRRLTVETGASFAQWRVAARMHAAAGLLAQGRDLEWVAHRVGYATLSSFAHAFRSAVGTSPGRFAARHRTAVEASPAIPHVVAGPTPDIPPASPSPWVTTFDSVLWVQRGTARVTTLGERRELERGDVVWLGRAVAHGVEIDADSIVLPLGFRADGPPVRAHSASVMRMGSDERTELFLLHTVVANHFLLRPPGHDDQAFLDLLHPAPVVPSALLPHVAELVTAVIADPADRRTLAEWAGELGVEPLALRGDVHHCLGQPFASWRATVRMTAARAMLWDGLAPSVVARRLGYAHLPAFTRAFRDAYGMPPREWLRREAA